MEGKVEVFVNDVEVNNRIYLFLLSYCVNKYYGTVLKELVTNDAGPT